MTRLPWIGGRIGAALDIQEKNLMWPVCSRWLEEQGRLATRSIAKLRYQGCWPLGAVFQFGEIALLVT